MSIKSTLDLCHYCGRPFNVQSLRCIDQRRHSRISLPLNRDSVIQILLDGGGSEPERLNAGCAQYTGAAAARAWMRQALSMMLPVDSQHSKSAVWRLYSLFRDMLPDAESVNTHMPGITQIRGVLPEFYPNLSLVFYLANVREEMPQNHELIRAFLNPNDVPSPTRDGERVRRWTLIARPDRQISMRWDDYVTSCHRIPREVDVINLTNTAISNSPEVLIRNSELVLAVGPMENLPL